MPCETAQSDGSELAGHGCPVGKGQENAEDRGNFTGAGWMSPTGRPIVVQVDWANLDGVSKLVSTKFPQTGGKSSKNLELVQHCTVDSV